MSEKTGRFQRGVRCFSAATGVVIPHNGGGGKDKDEE